MLLAREVLVALSGSSWQRPMEDSSSVPVQEPPPANRDTNPEHNGRGECIHARPCLRVHVCETASAVPHKNVTLLFFPSVVGPASLHHADSVRLSRGVQRVVFQGHREPCWEQICYWWKSVNSIISILFTVHFISREVKICVRVEQYSQKNYVKKLNTKESRFDKARRVFQGLKEFKKLEFWSFYDFKAFFISLSSLSSDL